MSLPRGSDCTIPQIGAGIWVDPLPPAPGRVILVPMGEGNSRDARILRVGTLTESHHWDGTVAVSPGERLLASVVAGPYQPTDDSRPDRVRLARVGEAPAAQPAEVQFVAFAPDDEGVDALIEAMSKGDIDVAVEIPPDAVETIEGATLHDAVGASTAGLFLNARSKRVTTLRARQALASAVDHAEFAAVANGGRRDLGTDRLLPPSMDGRAAADPAALVFDPQHAAAQLKAEGLSSAELTMVIPWGPRPYMSDPWAAGEAIADALAEVGVGVGIVPADSPQTALDRALDGDYDIFLAGWIADDADPAAFLTALLDSRAIPGEGGFASPLCCNLGRLSDPAVDAALAVARTTCNPTTLRAVEDLAAAHSVAIPLCHGAAMSVVGPRVRSIKMLADGLPDLLTVEMHGA